MHRSKDNIKYWNDRVIKLFEIDPRYKKVKYIYDSIKLLLQEKYPNIREEDIQLIKDIIYLDRKLRLFREGEEQELKGILQQEYIINHLM